MNQLPDREPPESLASCIEFGAEAMLYKMWTATPAEVLSYDKKTRRINARIIPQDKIENERYNFPVVLSVPVMFNGGGGFTITAPIAIGDKVLLVFCMRDISLFKTDFENDKDYGSLMGIGNAVAIPCFGSLEVDVSDGLSLQKNDGSVKLEILNDSVVATTAGGTMVLDSSGIVTAKDFVTTTGVSLKGHQHVVYQPSTSPTAKPTPAP